MQQFMETISRQNAQLQVLIETQARMIEVLEKQKVKPTVRGPREYDVVVNKEDGEQVSMRISAPNRH